MIEAFATADHFNIRCAKCKRETLNEYLGYDPSLPVIRATCSTTSTASLARRGRVSGAGA